MIAEDYIARISEAFSNGRYDILLENFDYPLPIYINRSAAAAISRAETWSFLQALHGMIRARGFKTLAGRVVSVELPQRDRFRMWVDWFGFDAGRADLLFKTICYNVGSHAEHRTEMCSLQSQVLAEIEQLVKAA